MALELEEAAQASIDALEQEKQASKELSEGQMTALRAQL